MTSYKWPTGKHADKIRKRILALSDLVSNGTLVSVDPASGGRSMPGWALFECGELVGSGTICLISKMPVHKRLPQLLREVSGMWSPDVLAVEELRGRMVPHQLHWSVGALIAGVAPPELLEIPVNFWQALAPEDYEKTDEGDAILIGRVVTEIIKGDKQ